MIGNTRKIAQLLVQQENRQNFFNYNTPTECHRQENAVSRRTLIFLVFLFLSVVTQEYKAEVQITQYTCTVCTKHIYITQKEVQF